MLSENCQLCSLGQPSKPVVGRGIGFPGGVVFVGEAPGEKEVEQNRAFVGPAGQLLNWGLSLISLTPSYITNMVLHRPPGNRSPRPEEVATCWENWVYPLLLKLQPKLLVAVGSIASEWLTGLKVGKTHGSTCPALFPDLPPVFGLVHPAAILRDRPRLMPMYEADWLALRARLAAVTEPSVGNRIVCDLETTGLSPRLDTIRGIAVYANGESHYYSIVPDWVLARLPESIWFNANFDLAHLFSLVSETCYISRKGGSLCQEDLASEEIVNTSHPVGKPPDATIGRKERTWQRGVNGAEEWHDLSTTRTETTGGGLPTTGSLSAERATPGSTPHGSEQADLQSVVFVGKLSGGAQSVAAPAPAGGCGYSVATPRRSCVELGPHDGCLADSLLRVEVDDVALMAAVLGRPVRSLKDLARADLGIQHYSIKDLTTQAGVEELTQEVLAEKALADVAITARFCTLYEAELKRDGLYDIYLLERRAAPIVRQVEQGGLHLDLEGLRQLQETNLSTLEGLTDEAAGYMAPIEKKLKKKIKITPPNPNSPQQVVSALTSLGVKLDKRTPKGALSADSEVLANIDHPFTRALAAMRRAKKMVDFSSGLLQEQEDGVVYPKFNQVGAVSGRFSSGRGE